jgi:hypothetical protein
MNMALLKFIVLLTMSASHAETIFRRAETVLSLNNMKHCDIIKTQQGIDQKFVKLNSRLNLNMHNQIII